MHDTLQIAMDTLSVAIAPKSAATDTLVHCADSVFLGGERIVEPNMLPALTALDMQLLSPLVQALMLTVVLLYLFVVYRRHEQVTELASWVFMSSPQPIFDSHIDRHTLLPWRLLGLFSLGSIATISFYKYFDATVDAVPLTLVLGATVLVALVWLLQNFLVWAIGEVTLKQRFTSAVSAIRRFAVELSGIFLTPFVVAYSFSGESGSNALWVIILLILIILIGVFAFKLLKMFVATRFSIFYWILYLCAVEIFPMSLAVIAML